MTYDSNRSQIEQLFHELFRGQILVTLCHLWWQSGPIGCLRPGRSSVRIGRPALEPMSPGVRPEASALVTAPPGEPMAGDVRWAVFRDLHEGRDRAFGLNDVPGEGSRTENLSSDGHSARENGSSAAVIRCRTAGRRPSENGLSLASRFQGAARCRTRVLPRRGAGAASSQGARGRGGFEVTGGPSGHAWRGSSPLRRDRRRWRRGRRAVGPNRSARWTAMKPSSARAGGRGSDLSGARSVFGRSPS